MVEPPNESADGCGIPWHDNDGEFGRAIFGLFGDNAARNLKNVVPAMMLKEQNPENAEWPIEDEAQKRLNRKKPRRISSSIADWRAETLRFDGQDSRSR